MQSSIERREQRKINISKHYRQVTKRHLSLSPEPAVKYNQNNRSILSIRITRATCRGRRLLTSRTSRVESIAVIGHTSGGGIYVWSPRPRRPLFSTFLLNRAPGALSEYKLNASVCLNFHTASVLSCVHRDMGEMSHITPFLQSCWYWMLALQIKSKIVNLINGWCTTKLFATSSTELGVI